MSLLERPYSVPRVRADEVCSNSRSLAYKPKPSYLTRASDFQFGLRRLRHDAPT
jgi:hypothetical protein